MPRKILSIVLGTCLTVAALMAFSPSSGGSAPVPPSTERGGIRHPKLYLELRDAPVSASLLMLLLSEQVNYSLAMPDSYGETSVTLEAESEEQVRRRLLSIAPLPIQQQSSQGVLLFQIAADRMTKPTILARLADVQAKAEARSLALSKRAGFPAKSKPGKQGTMHVRTCGILLNGPRATAIIEHGKFPFDETHVVHEGSVYELPQGQQNVFIKRITRKGVVFQVNQGNEILAPFRFRVAAGNENRR